MSDLLQRLEAKRAQLYDKLKKVDARIVRYGGTSMFKISSEEESHS